MPAIPPFLTFLTHYRFLTGLVRQLKSPNQFIKNFYFPSSVRRNLHTEYVEWGKVSNARMTAPFVKRGAPGRVVPTRGEEARLIAAPNIRLKTFYSAGDLLFTPGLGAPMFPASINAMRGYALQKITDDLQELENHIANTEEWLCAQALTGVINYESPEGDAFTIDYQKPNGNTITPTNPWTDTVDGDPKGDIFNLKRLMSDEGVTPTDAICSGSAADAFLNHPDVAAVLDNRNIDAGAITLNSQFNEDGVIFLGRFMGINWWSYERKVSHQGVEVPMIRDGFIEFVARNAITRSNRLFYAAVEDLMFDTAFRPGPRYSKSWEEKDPSGRWYLLASRPLPAIREPELFFSMDVV